MLYYRAMRKLSFLFLVVAIFIFSACMKSEKIGSIVFSVDDGPIPPQFYSVEDLQLTPTYEDRTLTVTYKQGFPNRTEETIVQDSEAQGEVGGEFFDRFEELVDFAKDYDQGASNSDLGIGFGVFKMSVFNESGELLYEVDSNWSDDGISTLKDFFLDLKTLLTAEVPV